MAGGAMGRARWGWGVHLGSWGTGKNTAGRVNNKGIKVGRQGGYNTRLAGWGMGLGLATTVGKGCGITEVRWGHNNQYSRETCLVGGGRSTVAGELRHAQHTEP